MSSDDVASLLPFDLGDEFYRAINPIFFDKGKILRAAFQNTTGTDRMSVDWTRFSTPEIVLGNFPRWGGGAAVALITARLCIEECSQEIEYTPETENPAHCDVVGEKTPAIRKRFMEGCTLVTP